MIGFQEMKNRGTQDFPFSRYHFEKRISGSMITQTHWHPDMEILYLRRGALEVRLRQNLSILSAGDILLIHPNMLHNVRVVDDDTCYDALVFSWDLLALPEHHFLQRQLLQPLLSGAYCFPDLLSSDLPVYSQALPLIRRICDADPSGGNYKLSVFSDLLAVFSLLSEHCPLIAREDSTPHPDQDSIKNCLSYLSRNFRNHLTLQEIAQQVHLHPNYLCARFKCVTGQTVFQHLTQLRLEEAARLLRTTRKSISQIAAECGFESTGFFTRKFKAFMGITPKTYSLNYGFSSESS